MANPRAEKNHAAIEVVARTIGIQQNRLYFAPQLGRHSFVGVENHHPLIAKRQRVEGPVLLTRIAFERMLDDVRAPLLGNLDGSVVRIGVDHEHLVRPGHAVQTVGQVQLLVERWHQH